MEKRPNGKWIQRCKVCRNRWSVPAPDVFQDEHMTCVMCGKVQQADPDVESNWRMLEVDAVRYYACTDHFPADGSTAKAFEVAYMAVIRKIIELRQSAS